MKLVHFCGDGFADGLVKQENVHADGPVNQEFVVVDGLVRQECQC